MLGTSAAATATAVAGLVVFAGSAIARPSSAVETRGHGVTPLKEPLDACRAIAAILPDIVAYPNSTVYQDVGNYWSNQQKAVHPDCFVSPRNTHEVSRVMKKITCARSRFSVKGGGHSAFAGASNSEGGVTIDFMNMKAISVSDDRKTVSVGPGVDWIEVFDVLDPLKLGVVGGRAASVGVSGLILGGGLSYFSEKYGLACDNVRRFEVVLSSGKVVNASAMENRDLYWALRGGGGSNFGIVTAFHLAAFDQGDLWASDLIFPGVMNQTLIAAYTDLVINGLPTDSNAHTYMVLTYSAAAGGYIVLTSIFYAKPQPAGVVPPVYYSIEAQPGAIVNTTRNANVSTLARGIDEPVGSRQTWWDVSIALRGPELLQAVVPLWKERTDKLLKAAGTTEFAPYLTFQPFSTSLLKNMQKNGGNALDLDPNDGPLMLVQLATTWADPSLDDAIEASWGDFLQQVEHMAKEKGVGRDFIYMNYASETQPVLRGYGQKSYDRLRRVASRYDPNGTLQKLWKGYFQF